jgi:hypothetical protein
LKDLAAEVTTDAEHKFELALSAGKLEDALALARALPAGSALTQWRALGDTALARFRFAVAREAYAAAGDTGALFLLSLASGDSAGLAGVADKAEGDGAHNLAFAARLQLGDAPRCAELLAKTGRAPEAALFARTFAPRWAVLALAHRSVSHRDVAARCPRPSTRGRPRSARRVAQSSRTRSQAHRPVQSSSRRAGKRRSGANAHSRAPPTALRSLMAPKRVTRRRKRRSEATYILCNIWVS